VSFAEPGAVTQQALIDFWITELRSAYPILEFQEPYSAPIEQLDVPILDAAALSSAMVRPTTGPRIWVWTSNREQVVQLQPGWFACNWRKTTEGSHYRHWPERRQDFAQILQRFRDFLLKTQEGFRWAVSQCEVTYVNHITPNEQWKTHADFERIFAVAFGRKATEKLEQLALEVQYALELDERRVGRLHVKVTPAFFRASGQPVYILELTARGSPVSSSGEDVLAFLDSGRRVIVNTFLDITKPEMHGAWKRVNQNDTE
jgi:uncharacterized protein (TIGR04255 family)